MILPLKFSKSESKPDSDLKLNDLLIYVHLIHCKICNLCSTNLLSWIETNINHTCSCHILCVNCFSSFISDKFHTSKSPNNITRLGQAIHFFSRQIPIPPSHYILDFTIQQHAGHICHGMGVWVARLWCIKHCKLFQFSSKWKIQFYIRLLD